MATAAEIQTAYKALYRADLNPTVAQAIADTGITVAAYTAQELPKVASTTQAAVAITAFVTGVTPTSAQLDALKVEADKQVASYTALGVGNPALGAFEAFGRGLATDASTTATFNTKYGSLSTSDFITTVYAQVYGATPSAAAAANLTAQITYFTNLYTANNVPNAALAAKGAVLGQIVGYAFTSSASANSALDNQVASFLTTAAGGTTTGYGAALPAAANTAPPGGTFTLTPGSDFADSAGAYRNGSTNPFDFKFTAGNETVVASNATLGVVNNGQNDSLIDVSTADNDVLQLSLAGAVTGAPVVQNIETLAITASGAAGAIDLTNFSGLKTVTVSGTPTGGVTLTAPSNIGITKVDASGLTSAGGTLNVQFNATQAAAVEVIGGSANDIIVGGNGADKLSAGAGNDFINGGAGADTIDGGDGNDNLIGLTGNDIITGGGGLDAIDGGADNDTLSGGGGGDSIVAGAGNNIITGGGGNDVIVLGTVAGGTAATAAAGSANGDSIVVNGAQVTFVDASNGGAGFGPRNLNAADFTDTGNGGTTPLLVATAAGSNTVKFEATATDNGNDAIIGFNTGALANGGDVLDFSAFLGAAASRVNVNATDGVGDNVTDYNIITFNVQLNAITDAITYKANAKYVLISDATADSNVFYASTDANGVLGNVTQVANLVGVATPGDLINAQFV